MQDSPKTAWEVRQRWKALRVQHDALLRVINRAMSDRAILTPNGLDLLRDELVNIKYKMKELEAMFR